MIPSFKERLETLNWDDITLRINSKTSHDVERALANDMLTLDDFMALLSPAAQPFIETMAQRAQMLTRQRFTMQLGFTSHFIYRIYVQMTVLIVVFQ